MANIFNIDDYLVSEKEIAPRLKVPVCIPRKRFRIKKGCEYCAYLICEENKWYVVHPDLVEQESVSRIQHATLYKGLLETGELFLLPVTHPMPGKSTSWHDGWMEVIEEARCHWVEAVKLDNEQCYAPEIDSENTLPAPRWPKLSMKECLQLAFAKRYIDSISHPVLKKQARTRSSAAFDEDNDD